MDYSTIANEGEKAMFLDFASKIVDGIESIKIGIPDYRIDSHHYFMEFKAPQAIEMLKKAFEVERDCRIMNVRCALNTSDIDAIWHREK